DDPQNPQQSPWPAGSADAVAFTRSWPRSAEGSSDPQKNSLALHESGNRRPDPEESYRVEQRRCLWARERQVQVLESPDVQSRRLRPAHPDHDGEEGRRKKRGEHIDRDRVLAEPAEGGSPAP